MLFYHLIIYLVLKDPEKTGQNRGRITAITKVRPVKNVPIERKNVVMGTVWSFSVPNNNDECIIIPCKGVYTFISLCQSRMVI